MIVAPSRWRLLELRRRRRAVRSGIDLLDRKREALARELAARAMKAAERRRHVGTALASARAAVAAALTDVGAPVARAAAAAQEDASAVEVQHDVVLGIRLPRLTTARHAFQLSYAPGGTSRALDLAAEAYAALLPAIADLASREVAVVTLRTALARTLRTLNALQIVLLPDLDAQIMAMAAGLEEEERDEWVRRRAFTGSARSITLPSCGGTSDRSPGVPPGER